MRRTAGMSATALDQGPVADQHQRPLRVLRLSLTARCNLACPYCLPDGQEAPGLLNQAQQLAVDRKSTRLNSSHSQQSRMPSSA